MIYKNLQGSLKFSPQGTEILSVQPAKKRSALVQTLVVPTCKKKTGTDSIRSLESEVSCTPGPQRSQSAMTLPSSSSSNATVMGLSPSMARSLPKSFDSSSPLFFDLQHILNIPVQV